MRDKRKKKDVRGKIERILEFPREISTAEPKFTVSGFNQILIENYKGILEYEEFYIKISTFIGNVNINGFNLILNQMTEDDIMIQGVIDSIDFEKTMEEEEM